MGADGSLMGLECEYGLSFSWDAPVGGVHPAGQVAALLAEAVEVPRVGSFLSNGGRLYPDVGHLEYCTPECADPMSVLTADRAGDEIAVACTRAARERLAGVGASDVGVVKHSLDPHGNHFGCHENYLVGADKDIVALAEALAGHLVTRVLYTGSGHYSPGGYSLSQRAGSVWEVSGTSSTQVRPLVHLKDEPHADRGRWQRLHVLAGEANVAEVSTWLKLGSTSLVCAALAEDRSARRWCPESVRAAALSCAAVGDGTGRFRTRDGRVVTALACQQAYLELAARWVQRSGGPAWAGDVLERWAWVLDEAGRGAEGLVGVIDWATKRALLEGVAARNGSWASPRVAYADLRYHALEGGLARRLERSGRLERLSQPARVAAAVTGAPEVGRARCRGRAVQVAAARRGGARVLVGWDTLKVADSSFGGLADPFFDDEPTMLAWLDDELGRGAGAGALG